MRSKRKRIALLIVSVCASGCAQSDYPNMRPTRSGARPAKDAKLRNLEDEKPPKILPETHFAAGMLFERQGQVDKAVTQYRKAVALNHHYVAAYHRLGLVLSAVGHHDDALAALQRAAELRPENAAIYNNLGFEYLLTGQLDEAEDELRRAIKLQPTFARAHVNLALVMAKTGRFEEALVSFRQVLPEADAYYNLGLIFRGQQRYPEAVVAFERTLSLDPEFTAARTQLAEINARMPAPSKTEAEPTPQAVVAEAPKEAPAEVPDEAPWAPTPADMELLAIVDAILLPTPPEQPSQAAVEPAVPELRPEPTSDDAASRQAEVPLPVVEPEAPVAQPEARTDDVRAVAAVAEPFEEVEPTEPSRMPDPSAQEEPAVAVNDTAIMPDAMVYPTTVAEPVGGAGEPDADEIITVVPTATMTEPTAMRDSWMMLEELETKVALLRQDMGGPALAYMAPAMPLVVDDSAADMDSPPAAEPSIVEDEAFDETPVVHTDEEKADSDAHDPTAMAEPMPDEPKVVEVMFVEPATEPCEMPAGTSDDEDAWVEAFGDLEALLSVVINETHCWEQLDNQDALTLRPADPCTDDAAGGSVANDSTPVAQPDEAFEEFVEEEAPAQLDDGSR